jgi:antitoxin component of MazEF toxin-antitoxin module
MHTTKLTRIDKSTGLILPPDVLAAAAGLQQGDEVSVEVRDGRIEIIKANDTCNNAADLGRRFAARYRRTMAILSK